MECLLTYYPYQSHKKFLPLLVGGGAFSFALSVYFFHQSNTKDGFFLLLIGFMCIVLINPICDPLKKYIVFDADRMIVHDGKACCMEAIWDLYRYGYHSHSIRGHRFLLISSRELNKDEAEQLCNRSAGRNKIMIDGVIVLFVDPIHDAQDVKEQVLKHIQRFKDYN